MQLSVAIEVRSYTMRESRLFSYTPSSELDHAPSVFISVPSVTSTRPTQFQGRWAGVAGQIVVWRVQDASLILLEHLITGAALRIVLSSPLCARPLFLPTSDSQSSKLSLVVACHTAGSGSTLLNLHLSRSLKAAMASPEAVEKSRHFIPSSIINDIQRDGPDAVLGLSDGRCARFILSDEAHPPQLVLFSNSSKRASAAGHSASTASIQHNRSSFWRPQASVSFVSRFFTPRASDLGMAQVSSTHTTNDTLPSHSGPTDSVLALSVTHTDRRLVASLHASGTVCMHMLHDDIYVFEADCALPCKLSTSSRHFLLTGPESLLVVVLADEHPKADSLRVFELTIVSSFESPVALSCRQLVCREGPIPPLVAAAFFAEDVVVATKAGVVTALINEPLQIPAPGAVPRVYPDLAGLSNSSLTESVHPLSSKGLPAQTLWTAIDDVDEPYGFGRSMDALPGDDRAVLLRAHRFSPYAIAKALRLHNPSEATHEYIIDALSQIFLDEVDDGLKRVKSRAEQITKREDLIVRDISWIDSIGLVISREHATYVLRPLFQPEKEVFIRHEGLLSCDQVTPCGPTAWLLSSHAICQILSAQFLGKMSDSEMRKVMFMIRIATRYSDTFPDMPLTDLICLRQAEVCASENKNPMLIEVVNTCKSILQPGPMLLSTLLATGEWETLGEAADNCAAELPVSSMFANGIVWLERFHRNFGGEFERDEDLDINESENSTESSTYALGKAYGFFSFAAEECGKDAQQDDMLCALSLAGYPTNKLQSETPGNQMKHDDDWRTLKIPINQDFETVDEKDSIQLGDCAFWLLERALRIMEGYSAPRTAAAIALKAMAYAPDKHQHERMRAAAFSRFLEAGELENAHKAILSEPFSKNGSLEVTKEEAEALRDSIGLFINATADRNKLKWLAEQKLPEPLRMLCGQALERRARGTDVANFGVIARQFLENRIVHNVRSEQVRIRDEDDSNEYEDLFAWHILREDHGNAAQFALERAERLSSEGPELVRVAVEASNNDHSTDVAEMYMSLLLEWMEYKCEALCCVASAIRMLPLENQYVARPKISLVEGHRTTQKAVVNLNWVSRRLLLAHAQRIYLTESVIGYRQGTGAQNVDHLVAEWNPFLSETKSGIEWVTSMLRKTPTFDRMILCAELCCAWREEIGDECLTEMVREAGRVAARGEVNFDYSDLDILLEYISSVSLEAKLSHRNWYLLAVENALSTCAGRASCPQWLIDVAAYGKSSGNVEPKRLGGSHVHGDVLGTVRALMRNNRPVQAAQVIIRGLEFAEQSMKDEKPFYVSYAAIDATLMTLSQISEDYVEANIYHKRLTDKVKAHMELAAKVSTDAHHVFGAVGCMGDRSTAVNFAERGDVDMSDNRMEDAIGVH